jgi:hypothetical protein
MGVSEMSISHSPWAERKTQRDPRDLNRILWLLGLGDPDFMNPWSKTHTIREGLSTK